ncbi:MAG: cytochrome oxidase Cu insertion factor (SCO1/SenC/PrrC family) [Planctomycetota bacterium]|jgi:cytochrome oxidase Cu insertion factor (SCO1/SenC/PrrC family)
MIYMSRLSLLLVAVTMSLPACAQQSFVDRMNKGFKNRSPKAGEMLPDAAGFHADGKPFALKDTRGKLTVLVTGCLT